MATTKKESKKMYRFLAQNNAHGTRMEDGKKIKRGDVVSLDHLSSEAIQSLCKYKTYSEVKA